MPSIRRPLASATISLTGALAMVAFAATDALAQRSSGGGVPSDGDWSVMINVFQPTEATNFGIFRMFGDRMNLGMEVDLDYAEGEQTVRQGDTEVHVDVNSWVVVVGPSLRWYGNRVGPVSPYLRTTASVGWGGAETFVNGNEQRNDDEFILDATLGIGAEWYPLRWLGIAGHTGFRWTRIDSTSPPDRNDTEVAATEQFFSSFRSGLVASFYFR